MTFALWMVLVAGLLPYVTVAFAKAGGGYDNAQPRQWTEGLQGRQQRLEWAHRNHFEAFPFFAAAVLVSHLAGAPGAVANTLAGVFVVLRVAYTWAYAVGRPGLRSVLWFGALACVLGLFIASGFGG